MSAPIEVDVPHQLGIAAAKQRIAGGFGKFADFVPGGAITEHRWEGDTLHFTMEGLGQRISARMDVGEANVHCALTLPAFLGLFADRIRAKLEREAPKLLE